MALLLGGAAVLIPPAGGHGAGARAAEAATEPAAERDAAAFVLDLADRALKLLQNRSLGAAEREARLRELARQSLDVDGVTRFLAGRAWRTASEEERRAFRALLEDYMMRVYAVRIGVLENAPALHVRSVRREGDSSVVVSEFTRADGPPVRVSWRVVRRPEGFRIADVSVEGVSLAITQRDEFAAVIERNGGTLEGLMRVLRQRIAEAETGR